VNLVAHASLVSAVVRTVPRRLPIRENQLARKSSPLASRSLVLNLFTSPLPPSPPLCPDC
jgi:hypothetical protein